MRDSIYTIPISEVFEPRCGCPFCTLQETLETRCVEYILGAAMMEPDVRIETNKYGFCGDHFAQMQTKNNKLPLALMIASHLDDLRDKNFDAKPKKKEIITHNCFICKEIEGVMEKQVENSIVRYISDSEFRKLFNEQPFFCYPHFKLLCQIGQKTLNKKQLPPFIDDVTVITRRKLDEVLENVYQFTQTFDYRNSSKVKTPEVNAAIPSAVKYLTGK